MERFLHDFDMIAAPNSGHLSAVTRLDRERGLISAIGRQRERVGCAVSF